MKIVVLMGGPSGEHEISLKSGHGVTEALARRGWNVEPLVIPHALTVEEARDFSRERLHRAGAGVAFLALHGPFGEDGTIQQLCEELHVAYTGSSAIASRLGMDKVASRRRFESVGLAVPRWCVVDLADVGSIGRRLMLREFSYPLVVKPTGQGSSLGVSIVRCDEELPTALAEAGRYGDRALIEQFVRGREVTAGVFGEEPLPVVEIRSRHGWFDYAAKYTKGLTEYIAPAPLAPPVAQAVQAAGLAAHRAVGCRHLSRTDIILDDRSVPVVLEVNTIPGFTPTSLLPKAAACIGLSYDELCERLVLMACPAVARTGCEPEAIPFAPSTR